MSGDMKCQGTSSVRRYEVSGDILISGFSQGHQVSGDNYVRISQGTSSVWGHQVPWKSGAGFVIHLIYD